MTSPSAVSARWRTLAIVVLAILVCGASTAASAQAAETYTKHNRIPKVNGTAFGTTTVVAKPNNVPPIQGVVGVNETVTDALNCGSWYGSGGFDEAGTHYASCGSNVLRINYAGTRLADIRLPLRPGSATQRITTHDVAPSPDGQFLYFVTGTDMRPADAGAPDEYKGHLWRLKRDAAGNYAMDHTFTPEQFNAGMNADGTPKKWWAKGLYISTDAFGDIYFSNGSWNIDNPNMVLKYGPDGNLKTQFGDHADNFELGKFRTNMGIAATRDGRSIYVVEQTNGRVQRFDYQPNGSYAYAITWGKTNTNQRNAGEFAAPYDIGLDPWNMVYVMDTTWGRVQKFTPTGQYLATVSNTPLTTGKYLLSHGVSVSARGNFYMMQDSSYWKRTAQNPEPGPWLAVTPLPLPDVDAPVLNDIVVPVETINRTIAINVDATDNRAVTGIRIAGEDGYFGEWFGLIGNTHQHQLTAGYGPKAVTVQVRDAAGNESAFISKTVVYRDADNVAPVLNEVTLPATSTVAGITIQINATDNVGVTRVQVADETGDWGEWKAFNANLPHTVSAGYGVKGVFLKVADNAGNESGVLYRTMEYRAPDAPPPPPPPAGDIADPVLVSATIPIASTTNIVTVTTEATDDKGVTRIRFANEDGTWGVWRTPYAAQVQHQLTANNGGKAVFVQVGDAAGKESNVILLRTKVAPDAPPPPPPGEVDAQAPVLNDATVPALTGTRNITVGMAATDNVGVAQFRIANEDGNWGPWTAYAAQVNHTLTVNYGAKAIFVQVRDASGNESGTLLRRLSYQMDAPVIPDPEVPGPIDAADPVLNMVVVPNPAITRQINVELEATDDIGVAQVRFANEDGNWGAWVAFAGVVQHQLTANAGPKAVFVQVRDAAGRESNVRMVRTTLQ